MDFDPEPVDLRLNKATRAAAVASELFGLAQKARAKKVADKYFPKDDAQNITGILVDDVEYPDIEAVLVTFQAFAGEHVHMRNLIRAVAASVGLELPPWNPSVRWRDTISEKWRRL